MTADLTRRKFLALATAIGAGSLVAPGSGRAAVDYSGQDDLVGELRFYTTAYEDTLLQVARDHGLGLIELMAANRGVDPWLPGDNRRLLLPTAHVLPDASRRGIIINLADLRLYLFGKDGQAVASFPLGVGRDGARTPKGRTKVVRKAKDPAWHPPASIRREDPELPGRVPPGPDNPLGTRALYLGWPAYLIHGTNKPYGVGRRVSHGCIRMYPENVEWLYEQVPVGTPVTVVDQRVKLGRRNGDLFLEVTPSREQIDQIEESGVPDLESDVLEVDPDPIVEAAGNDEWRLNWTMINWAYAQREGIPVQITR